VRYLFEGYVLDADRRELRLGADLTPVEPQVFDVLAYLIENRERVVSKEDLLASVWEGRSVSESALTTRINAARKAIGDSGGQQRLIKTLPRKGFRFVGVVREEQQQTAAAALAQPTAALALPDRPSIAVLPFTNISGDAEQEYIADGIVEDITTELSRFRELFVIARNSSFHYKGQATDVRRVGRELGVRYVLEGSIRRDHDRLRISAQLVDAMTGAHRWAERYDRDVQDIFAVQDEVARTVAAILAAHVSKAEAERTLLEPPASLQAHDYYMRAAVALTSYNSSFRREDLRDARRLLQHALALDPNYSRAHAALSMTCVSCWAHRWDEDCPWPAALDRAHLSAHKAVQLTPNLPEAHVGLGWALIWKRQHEAAIAEFERAIALNPNFTNWRFAYTLIFAGEPTRAIQALEAHIRLDPFYEPYAPGAWGFACYILKRYAEALPRLRECVSRAPNMRAARVWLAATYAQLGQLDNARAEAAEILRIDPCYTVNESIIVLTLKRSDDTEHVADGLRKAGLPVG
jgi:adenylate cyclase